MRNKASRATMIRLLQNARYEVLPTASVEDTLLEFLATLQRATALVSPDSGPVHMATTVGTPVVGLFAATNPQRSGPYYSRQWCVDRYEKAASRYMNRSASKLPWTEKIDEPGVMDLIEIQEVTAKLDDLLGSRI